MDTLSRSHTGEIPIGFSDIAPGLLSTQLLSSFLDLFVSMLFTGQELARDSLLRGLVGEHEI